MIRLTWDNRVCAANVSEFGKLTCSSNQCCGSLHFDADPDADPACQFDADLDPACHFDADLDPIFHIDADPDPDPNFQIKAQNLEKEYQYAA